MWYRYTTKLTDTHLTRRQDTEHMNIDKQIDSRCTFLRRISYTKINPRTNGKSECCGVIYIYTVYKTLGTHSKYFSHPPPLFALRTQNEWQMSEKINRYSTYLHINLDCITIYPTVQYLQNPFECTNAIFRLQWPSSRWGDTMDLYTTIANLFACRQTHWQDP